MLLPTWPLLAFLFLFPLEWNAEALSFKSLKRQQSNETANAKDEKSKQVAFDQQGVLYVFIYFVFRINVLKKSVINGTISGRTEPIVVDRKPLPKYCNIKPYYVFSVCPENLLKVAQSNGVCSEG